MASLEGGDACHTDLYAGSMIIIAPTIIRLCAITWSAKGYLIGERKNPSTARVSGARQEGRAGQQAPTRLPPASTR